MKQKRKVKSLISSESGSNLLLTTLLFLLWWVLCFWAVSLFTSSVWVEASGPSSEVTYEWIDDQVEVVFDLSFAPENDLGNAVSNMYLTTEGTFYMEWEVVNSSAGNAVDANNAYLLWWEWANIASDNITLIWGSNNGSQNNDIQEGNPNAAILWWEWNIVSSGNNKNPAVLLWWKGNTIWTNQDGDAIIGWNNNVIGANVVNSYILWWESNQIFAGSKNVIVWGKQVLLDRVLSNIFAFADRNFIPKWSNAFYLYVTKGLWLWEKSEQWWVASKWPVSFGDVSGKSCTDANIGVQWTLGWCLVWCTALWVSNDQKWELIDHWDTCEVAFNTTYSSSCMVYVPTPEPKPTYTSQCTVGNVDTSNATHCASNLLDSYENVLFETYLVDSDDHCPDPNAVEDKCAFRCNQNFHLTWDKAWGTNKVKCYADCQLPWNPNETIKHNQKITGYNVETVSCSNNSYVFPRDTKIINFPTKTYTVQNGKVKNWTSYESCTTHDHRKTIVCNNGHLYLAKSNGQADTAKEVKRGWTYNYVYESCTLEKYDCPTTVYNLDRNFITTTWKEASTISWNNKDRATTTWARWYYKLCIDWAPHTVQNGASCDKRPVATGYHYQLTKCLNNYSTWVSHPYECRKKCLLDGNYYVDGATVLGYKTGSVQCPNVCESMELTCHDWVWSWNADMYPKSTCDVTPYECTWYNVSQDTYDSHKNDAEYEACQLLKKNGIYECIGNGYKYKLTGCKWDRHVYTLSDPQYCVENYQWVACDSNVTLGVWETVVTGVPVLVTWVSNWPWDTNWHWTSPAKCQKKCDDGYYGDPGNCTEKCKVKTCDSSFNLTSYSQCPMWWKCSSCTPMDEECNEWDTKWRADWCDEDNGWYSDWAGGCKQNDSGPEDPDPECLWDEPWDNTRSWSTSPSSDTYWRYVSDTSATLGACEWTCKNNDYVRDGNTMDCKLDPSTPPSLWWQCVWEKPQHATLVDESDQGLTSDVTRTLYINSSAAAWKKCAYLCNTENKRFYYSNSAGVESCMLAEDLCGETANSCDIPGHSTNEWGDDSKYTWDCAVQDWTVIDHCSKCKPGYNLENGECIKRVTVNLYCSKSTTVSESSNTDFTPRGWQMNHSITLTLSQAVPAAVSATVSYDVDNGTPWQPRGGSTTTFAAYSTGATLSVESHDDGCHSLWLNPTAWHYILSNWWWEASEVRVWNIIYQFNPAGNGCTDDPYPTDYCQVSDCTFKWQTIPHNGSLTVYRQTTPPICPSVCTTGTVTCNNWKVSWDTGYNVSCYTRTNKPCDGDGWQSTTGNYDHVKSWDTCYVANGVSCITKYRVGECDDWYSWAKPLGASSYACVADIYVPVNVSVRAGVAWSVQYEVNQLQLLMTDSSGNVNVYYPVEGPYWSTQVCTTLYGWDSSTCYFRVPATEFWNNMNFRCFVQGMFGVGITYWDGENLGVFWQSMWGNVVCWD